MSTDVSQIIVCLLVSKDAPTYKVTFAPILTAEVCLKNSEVDTLD